VVVLLAIFAAGFCAGGIAVAALAMWGEQL
jgi:hypothetical protein